MCCIYESSRRRGFADFALEVFYIDFIEAGCSRKAPFVIRTKDNNIMDRASTLPLNLYETETVLKPVNLNSLMGVEKGPCKSDEPPNSNEDAQFNLPPESPINERVDSFSASDSDSESGEEVDSALETMNMIRPTRLGRVRTLTSRMADFLQAGMAGM